MGNVYRVALAAGIGLAVVTATPANAMPNTQCTLATPVREVRSLAQLPPELVKLLPPIADVGAPFNQTDSVNDPTLPFRRTARMVVARIRGSAMGGKLLRAA